MSNHKEMFTPGPDSVFTVWIGNKIDEEKRFTFKEIAESYWRAEVSQNPWPIERALSVHIAYDLNGAWNPEENGVRQLFESLCDFVLTQRPSLGLPLYRRMAMRKAEQQAREMYADELIKTPLYAHGERRPQWDDLPEYAKSHRILIESRLLAAPSSNEEREGEKS